MKAVICTKYGSPDVLQLQEVDKPIPKDNEVLIKIHATTVHIGDTKIRSFKPGLGFIKDLLFKPIMRILIGFTAPRKKILGMELSGEIAAVGKKVTLFKQGEPVFASTGMNFATYAEYTCIREDGVITTKPHNMSHAEAAPVCNGAITALRILKKANIKQGKHVLIYGASGSVGTYAVQLAKYFGAQVTAVCSKANLDMVKSLGADKVIDYTASNFTQSLQNYDVIFDAVGKMASRQARKYLNKKGVYLNVLTSSTGLILKAEDLIFLKQLIEANKLQTVIDRQYSLEKIVKAHSYVDKGHKKGNVVINILSPTK